MDGSNFFYRRLVLLDIQKSYFFLLSFVLKVSILMETQDEKNQIKYTFWIYQNSVKHCKHTSNWIKLLCVNLNIGEPFLKQYKFRCQSLSKFDSPWYCLCLCGSFTFTYSHIVSSLELNVMFFLSKRKFLHLSCWSFFFTTKSVRQNRSYILGYHICRAVLYCRNNSIWQWLFI